MFNDHHYAILYVLDYNAYGTNRRPSKKISTPNGTIDLNPRTSKGPSQKISMPNGTIDVNTGTNKVPYQNIYSPNGTIDVNIFSIGTAVSGYVEESSSK